MGVRTGAAQARRRGSRDSAAVSPAQALQEAQAARRRGRIQASLAVLCAVGVLVGMKMTRKPATVAPTPLSQALEGTWELQSVRGEPVGPNVDSVVIAQTVTFRQGRLQGETVLRAQSDAATVAMPFPDQSVRKVVSSGDGQEVRVAWEGTYQMPDEKRLELKVGQAAYRAAATFDAKTLNLALDHDVILTYPGPVRYRPVSKRP